MIDQHIKITKKDEKQHPKLQKTWLVYLMALNASIGSWFYGYNNASYIVVHKVIQSLNGWDLHENQLYTSLIISIMPLGCTISSLFTKQIISKIKYRRKCMFFFDLLGIIGVSCMLADHTLVNFLIGRFICGLTIGLNSSLITIYIKEYAPLSINGKAGSINQIMLTVGVLSIFLMSLLLPLPIEIKQTINYNDALTWRYIIGLPIILLSLRSLVILTIFRSDTPPIMVSKKQIPELRCFLNKIYVTKNDADSALKVYIKNYEEELFVKSNAKSQLNRQGANVNDLILRQEITRQQIKRIHPVCRNDEDQQQIHFGRLSEIKTQTDYYNEKVFELAGRATKCKRWFLGSLIQWSTQISGSTAIVFYASTLFQAAAGGQGIDAERTARFSTIGYGASMMVFSSISFLILGKVGRRTLYLVGVSIVIISLFTFSGIQYGVDTSNEVVSKIVISLLYLVNFYQLALDKIFIFFSIQFNQYQFGWQLSLGSVTWLYVGEICENQGLALSSFIRQIFSVIIGLSFPHMIQHLGLSVSFFIFAVLTLLCQLYFYFFLKETKGKKRAEMLESFCSPSQYKSIQEKANEFAQDQTNIKQKDQSI